MKPRKRCSTVLRVVVAKLLGVPRYVLDGIQLPPGLAWECLRVVVAGTRCGEWPKSSFSCQSGQDCRSGTCSVPADSLCFVQSIGCYTFSNVLPPKECVQPSSGRRRSPSAATSSASISSGHDRSAASAAASGMQPPVSLHRIDKHLEPFLAPSVTAAATFANGLSRPSQSTVVDPRAITSAPAASSARIAVRVDHRPTALCSAACSVPVGVYTERSAALRRGG